MGEQNESYIGLQKWINLDKAWRLSKSWKKSFIIWRTLEHFFVIGSFVASIATVYITASYPKKTNIIIILSSMAAILSVVGFACNPTKYMANYRMAFELLNGALISNTNKDGIFSEKEEAWKEVMDAIKLGEKYIGKTYDINLDFNYEVNIQNSKKDT